MTRVRNQPAATASQSKRRAKLIAQGQCISCMLPNDTDKQCCAYCRKLVAQRAKKRYQKRKKEAK